MQAFLIALIITSAATPGIDFESDTSYYETTSQEFLLQGNVRVTRLADGEDSITLYADTVAGRVGGMTRAEGDVRAIFRSAEVDAERGYYDFGTASGAFENVRMAVDRWMISSDELRVQAPDRLVLEDVRADLCGCDFSAKSGKVTVKDNRLTMYNSFLYFREIPFFWLPYFTAVPGSASLPVRISVGRSDFEGWFVKTSYLYNSALLGEGQIKADVRTHRGWGYGTYNRKELEEGEAILDLYRIEERDREARGLVRGELYRSYGDRVRSWTDIYYVTDRDFLFDYRFDESVGDPDPKSTGAVSYRGDASAFMLRVVGNSNRGDYEVIERLPELRASLTTMQLPGKVHLSGEAGATVFRHNHPYNSDSSLRISRIRRERAPLEDFARAHGFVKLQRPSGLGKLRITPYLDIKSVAYSEVNRNDKWAARTAPAAGVTFSRFLSFRPSGSYRYMLRPVLDISDRSVHGPLPGQTPLVEDVDLIADERPIRLTLDQAIYSRTEGNWAERMRIRLEGGYDLDKVESERWLPAIGELILSVGPNGRFTSEVKVDPNRRIVTDARVEAGYQWKSWSFAGSYFRRAGIPGIRDSEDVAVSVAGDISSRWSASFASSYNIEAGGFHHATYGLTYHFDCLDLGFKVVDQPNRSGLDFAFTFDVNVP